MNSEGDDGMHTRDIVPRKASECVHAAANFDYPCQSGFGYGEIYAVYLLHPQALTKILKHTDAAVGRQRIKNE